MISNPHKLTPPHDRMPPEYYDRDNYDNRVRRNISISGYAYNAIRDFSDDWQEPIHAVVDRIVALAIREAELSRKRKAYDRLTEITSRTM